MISPTVPGLRSPRQRRDAPTALAVGLAASCLWVTVFVSLGGHGHAAPGLTAPFSALLAPALFFGCPSILTAAVPAFIFVMWASSRRAREKRRATVAFLLAALAAAVTYEVVGWGYGLRHQGISYNTGMAIIGGFGWAFLLAAWIRSWLAYSQRVWLTVAWLFTYAFPYYGERL